MKHTPYIFKYRYLTSNILFQYPKANLDGEVTSGTITWTAEMGTWTLDGNQASKAFSEYTKVCLMVTRQKKHFHNAQMDA